MATYNDLIFVMQTLHSKLTTNSEAAAASNGIKSAVLYDGSITIFDSRLYGFDIGTCLEVLIPSLITFAEALQNSSSENMSGNF